MTLCIYPAFIFGTQRPLKNLEMREIIFVMFVVWLEASLEFSDELGHTGAWATGGRLLQRQNRGDDSLYKF